MKVESKMAETPNIDRSQRFIDATTHTVAWFWKRYLSNELNMKPPFQRKPVWQDGQKAYLIDTILRGYPVPELYLQNLVSEDGAEEYIVVDGQQRIRACLEYLNNGFPLGADSASFAGLKFDDLDSQEKRR